MRISELEAEKYEVKSRIMDAFKDIQSNAAALKDPEDDRARMNAIFTKMRDYMDDINRWRDELDQLETEIPDPEPENSGDSYF